MCKIFNKSLFILVIGIGYFIGIPLGTGITYFLIWPFKYHPLSFWIMGMFIIPCYMALTYTVFTSTSAWWLIYIEKEKRVVLKKIVKVVTDFKIDEISMALIFYTAPSKVFRGKKDGGIRAILTSGKKINKGALDVKIIDFLVKKFKENCVNFVIVQIISIRDGKIRVIEPYTGISKEIKGNVFELTSVENIPNLIKYVRKEVMEKTLK